MYFSSDENDYDSADEDETMEQDERQNAPAPNQRGEIYGDLQETFQLVSNCSARVVELLEKCGTAEDCEKIGNLVNRLAQLDEDLDKDRRAVDETWRQHGTDFSEQPILEKHFEKIRNELNVERPGRNRELFDKMKEKLAQIPEKMAAENGGGREGNLVIDGVVEDESIEMEMLSQKISDKDPITKKRIQNPVKNLICGHVYDRESIAEYIKFNKERRQLQQCPVEMCRNKQNIKMEHLVPFPEFLQMVRRARSRSRSKSRPRRSSGFGEPNQGQGPSTSSAAN